MGTQYGAVGISVAISGGMAVPNFSADQTQVMQYLQCSGSAQDMYTVPAGKTLYIYGFSWTVLTAAGAINIYQNDGATINYLVNAAANDSVVVSSPACPLMKYTTGQIVKVNGSTNGRLSFWGLLV